MTPNQMKAMDVMPLNEPLSSMQIAARMGGTARSYDISSMMKALVAMGYVTSDRENYRLALWTLVRVPDGMEKPELPEGLMRVPVRGTTWQGQSGETASRFVTLPKMPELSIDREDAA